MLNLYAALAKAKLEFLPIKKTKTNPHFKSKYADLEIIHAAVGPALAKHGLLLVEPFSISNPEALTILRVELIHVVSGEILFSEIILKSQDDTNPQKVGAATTYYRRYLLSGLLGIVADEDTDGETGERGVKPPMKNTEVKQQALPVSPQKSNAKVISKAQQARLYTICTSAGWSHEDAKGYLKELGFSSSSEIPAGNAYEDICNYIQDNPMGQR